MFDRFHSRARCVCCVVGPAVEEGVAVLDDGDGLPGEVVAGVGEEGEHQHGDPEHGLPPPGQAGHQPRHLKQNKNCKSKESKVYSLDSVCLIAALNLLSS